MRLENSEKIKIFKFLVLYKVNFKKISEKISLNLNSKSYALSPTSDLAPIIWILSIIFDVNFFYFFIFLKFTDYLGLKRLHKWGQKNEKNLIFFWCHMNEKI